MSRSRRDREEELLRRIIETDGIKKIQDAITAVISGDVEARMRVHDSSGYPYVGYEAGDRYVPTDVQDRAARLLGVIYGDDAGTPRKIAVDSSGKLRVVTT